MITENLKAEIIAFYKKEKSIRRAFQKFACRGIGIFGIRNILKEAGIIEKPGNPQSKQDAKLIEDKSREFRYLTDAEIDLRPYA